jgi:hypothetical protein
MRTSKAITWLSSLVAALAFVAAGVGLFWQGGSGPFPFTTLHGETVQLYGRGLYRYDTLFVGALNRGTDAVVLALGIPLLLVSSMLSRRGSPRGRFLLTGVLAYFLYVYASVALGATAYNGLFLVYVALFSASLFAFVRSFAAIGMEPAPASRSPRGLAVFMLACGAVTAIVWLGMGLLPALLRGEPPKLLDSYATSVTDALDLGIITPICFVTGILLLRRAPLGDAMAVSLLGILAILGPTFVAQTISQRSAGVSFTPGEVVGPIGGFGSLSLVAIGLLVALLRAVGDGASPRSAGGTPPSRTGAGVGHSRSRTAAPPSA